MLASILLLVLTSAHADVHEVNWQKICPRVPSMPATERARLQSILDREAARLKTYEIQLEELCDNEKFATQNPPAPH